MLLFVENKRQYTYHSFFFSSSFFKQFFGRANARLPKRVRLPSINKGTFSRNAPPNWILITDREAYGRVEVPLSMGILFLTEERTVQVPLSMGKV